MQEPTLKAEPIDGLADQEISLTVAGLRPRQRITLRSEMSGSKGDLWSASALFDADDRGRVDIATAIPLEGSYLTADPMGLIWSMRSPNAALFRFAGDSMEILFTLEIEGVAVDRKALRRFRGAPQLQKIAVRERGLVATRFLPPSKTPLPIVVVLGGSSGGLSEGRAHLLASHGIPALALAYFGCEGLPSTLKKIPLEYFEEALDWLKRHPAIDPERIGLWGTSRGGELALILGALFPDRVKAIAAHVPSSAFYGSLDNEAAAWTYRGEPLGPNAPFPPVIFDPSQGASPARAICLTPFFLEGMEQEAAFDAARIPVEKIKRPLLLISGQEDQMWPSALFCRQIASRAAHSVHLSYPGAGHCIFPPHTPTTFNSDFHPQAKLWFDFGGNPKDNAFARADAWKQTLSFFSENLEIIAFCHENRLPSAP